MSHLGERKATENAEVPHRGVQCSDLLVAAKQAHSGFKEEGVYCEAPVCCGVSQRQDPVEGRADLRVGVSKQLDYPSSRAHCTHSSGPVG